MIPENWSRNLQSYRNAATRKNKIAPRDHARTAQSQRERFERRRRADERYWRELMGGAA